MSSNKKLQGASGFLNLSGSLNVEDVFSTDVYTGSNGSLTVNNGIDLSGEGGLVWHKGRDIAEYHNLFDTVRGAGYTLRTSVTSAQGGAFFGQAFTSTGWSLNTSDNQINSSSNEYVAWTFRKAKKFFDVKTWSGNDTAGRQISHDLDADVGMIIIRATNISQNWFVWHRSLNNNQWLALSENYGLSTTGTHDYLNNTDPTSSVITLGSDNVVNGGGNTYIGYFFAHDTSDEGLIQCGTYTGNGSTSSGPHIDLGFEPQWLLVKSTADSTNWSISDIIRGFNHDRINLLYPHLSNAEASISTTPSQAAPTSTGFQIQASGTNFNTSSTAYIYVAIRRGLMGTPTTRASVFAVEALSGASGTRNYTTNFPVDMIMNPNTSGGSDHIPVIDRLRGTSETRPEWVSTHNNYGRDHPTSSSYGWGFDKSTGYTSKDIWVADQYGYAWRRAPGFFDIVVYTGNATNRTINHNLGVAPEFMVLKTTVTLADWAIYHGDATNYMEFNTNIASTDDQTYWNDTAPTDTVFTVGTANTVNPNNEPVVAYLFATLAGISKVGTFSHTNGSSTDVNCGFSSGSSFVIAKRTDSTGDWYLWDSARGINSGNDAYFLMNTTDAEVTNTDFIDPLNSGFQIASGFTTGTYFFYAIAA